MKKQIVMRIVKCSCGEGQKVLLFEDAKRDWTNVEVIGQRCDTCGDQKIDLEHVMAVKRFDRGEVSMQTSFDDIVKNF